MALQVYKVALVLMLDSFAASVAFVAFSEDPSERVFAVFLFGLVSVVLQLRLVLHLVLLFLVTLLFRHSDDG